MGIGKKIDLKEHDRFRNKKLPYVLLIGGIVLTFIALSLISRKEEEKIKIIMSTQCITSKDDIDRSVNVYPKSIPLSEYNALNNAIDSRTGEKMSPLIRADEINILETLHACDVIYSGLPLRRNMFTEKVSNPNPWKENVEEDYEFYTMDFNSSDVNTRLLFPGSLLRVRAIVMVPNEYLEEVKSALDQKDELIASGEMQDGESVLLNYSTQLKRSSGTVTNISNAVTPVSEVIFDKIRVSDLLNSNNESVYDIYMSLLSMPRSVRLSYLKTTVAEQNTTFMNRVMPNKLCFTVDKNYANILSEFESWGNAQLKYTILNEKNPNDIYSKIVDVSESIYDFSDTYNPASK